MARRHGGISALLALMSAACWGFGIVAAKGALNGGMPPFGLVAAQVGSSVVMLSAIASCAPRRLAWPRPRVAGAAALSGVLEYGATYALAALGLALTSAGNAAIIGAAEPALIVVAAAMILGERADRRLLALLALVTLGLALVILPDLASAGAPSGGDVLVLASAATGAIYAVLCRRLVASVAPLPLSVLQQSAGLAAVLCGLGLAALAGWAPLGPATVDIGCTPMVLAVLSGLLQHGAAAWLHLHALKSMSAGVFAMFLGLIPIFGLAAAHVALGEAITLEQIGGSGLVLVAAMAAARSGRRQSPELEKENCP